MSSLHRSILKTLAYYDTFDYPLTAEEVWRWLYREDGDSASPSPDDVRSGIAELEKEGRVERSGAYVVLAGRQGIVNTRTERMQRSVRLWNRATSTARFLELVPFVKMIAVVNTLAIDNVRPESDIDYLIVVAPGHMWIARMIVTGIVSLLGYRRHGDKIAGRICLSFYVTTEGMDFSKLKSANHDPHFAFWTGQAVPLIDDGTYEKFRAANTWVTTNLPHAWEWDWKQKLMPANPSLRGIRQFYEMFFSTPVGHWFEAMARDRQVKRMDKNVESKAKLGTTDVIISEDVLKFHEKDRRAEYNERFTRRCAELGLHS